MAKEYRIFIAIILMALMSIWLSFQQAFVILYATYLVYSLYRESILFQKYHEKRKRLFIKKVKKRQHNFINILVGLFFIAIGLIRYFNLPPEIEELLGPDPIMISHISLLSGFFTIISMLLKKCPTTEVIIRPDNIEVLQNGDIHLLTYSIRGFSISADTLKIEYAKSKTLTMDGLDINPQQQEILKEELTLLIEAITRGVVKRKNNWQRIKRRIKRAKSYE